jgi:hypothetical protein
LGNTFKAGNEQGRLFELPLSGRFIIGIFGGVGGCLHHIGFYSAPEKFANRRPLDQVKRYFQQKSINC